MRLNASVQQARLGVAPIMYTVFGFFRSQRKPKNRRQKILDSWSMAEELKGRYATSCMYYAASYSILAFNVAGHAQVRIHGHRGSGLLRSFGRSVCALACVGMAGRNRTPPLRQPLRSASAGFERIAFQYCGSRKTCPSYQRRKLRIKDGGAALSKAWQGLASYVACVWKDVLNPLLLPWSQGHRNWQSQ